MKKATLGSSYIDELQYLAFGGLSRNPFPMAPDDSGFYICEHTEKILGSLSQAILSKKGFLLFSGEIGLGKTTITRRLISTIEQKGVKTALVLNAFYQENDLLVAINKDFGIVNKDLEMTTQMELLNQFLLKENQEEGNCAIIIDDAQNLTFESLELIRMISNLEADQEKLVQILLVGQTELLEKMDSYELRQLKSRVVVCEQPLPLSQAQTERYIQYKLNIAGDTGRIQIEKNALKKLYDLSLGNLRKINIIMDKAMNQAFMDGTLVLHKKYIKDVFADAEAISKKNTNPYITIFLVSLSILLIGWGAGMLFFYQYKLKPLKIIPDNSLVNPLVNSKANPTVTKEKPKSLKKDQTIAKGTPAADSIIPEDPKKSPHFEQVAQFLSAYGLLPFENEFIRFLQKGKIQLIRDLIYQQTGLELIGLANISEQIQKQFDILAIDIHLKDRIYYLFWNPVIKINHFNTGYQGQEIKKLQQLLKNKRFYNARINGIVESILQKNIAKFQQTQDIKSTGFPDPETLFLLNHYSGKGE